MPVSVLRLPKGPDPNSRGFDPNSPRFIALCRTTIPTSISTNADAEQLQREQLARSQLRENFLRCLLSMTDKKVQFNMYEHVKVEATFGASDIDVLNFQVSDLHTPIGVQKEALIRCQDVISYMFEIWFPECRLPSSRKFLKVQLSPFSTRGRCGLWERTENLPLYS